KHTHICRHTHRNLHRNTLKHTHTHTHTHTHPSEKTQPPSLSLPLSPSLSPPHAPLSLPLSLSLYHRRGRQICCLCASQLIPRGERFPSSSQQFSEGLFLPLQIRHSCAATLQPCNPATQACRRRTTTQVTN